MPTPTEIDGAARRRADVLDLIGEAIRVKGYPPSVSELQEATGVGSSLTIRKDLEVLARDGKIERDAGVTRGIRLL